MDQATPSRILFSDMKYSKTGKTATIFKGKERSYKELGDKIEHFASFLLDNGLQKGDRVMLLLPNCPKMVVAYLGTLEAGGVMAALNPKMKEADLLAIAKSIQPKFFITLVDFDRLNKKLLDVLPVGCQTVITDLADDLPLVLRALYRLKNCLKSPKRGTLSWQDVGWFRNYGPRCYFDRNGDPVFFEISPDDLAVLQFTGGTTGTPKAAMLTHKNLAVNAAQALSVVGDAININSVVYGGLPFFHVFGLSGGLNPALIRGATIVLDPQPIVKSMLKLIQRHKINLFLGIPKMFAGMLNSPKFRRTNFDSLKLCVSGAGALDSSVKAEFERRADCEIIEGYGLSEASPVVCLNPPGKGKTGSLGLPVPGTEIQIVDGELWVRGPQVMKGYWENPKETADVITPDGWLKTGDLVKREGDYLIMTDRKKDMIKIRGENVYPSEIEAVIAAHPNVSEVAVVGIPDKEAGERIVACVTLKDGHLATSEAQLMAYCARELADQKIKIPKQLKVMKELPKSFLGKIQKKELREMLIQSPPR